MDIQEENTEKEPLLRRMRRFYFNSSWYSLFAASYLFLFAYFAIFYLDNVFSAISFVFRTFTVSTTLLSISHVIWGAVFVVSLLIPFVVSVCAVFALPNIWEKKLWKKDQKLLATIVAIIIYFAIIIVADDLMKAVMGRDVLDVFIQGSKLDV